MRKTKEFWNWLRFYDGAGLARYLEAQAEKGWMLGVDPDRPWTFYRVEPQKVHCAVVYIPKPEHSESTSASSDPNSVGPSAQNVWDRLGESKEANDLIRDQEFLEFCAHDGWELACEDEYKRIFYNTRPDPTPIYSDPETELENIHRSSQKYLKLQRGTLLVLLLRLVLIWTRLSSDFVDAISDHFILISDILLITIYGLAAEEELSYYLWKHRAKKAIEQGSTLDQIPCSRKFGGWLLAFVLFFLTVLPADSEILPKFLRVPIYVLIGFRLSNAIFGKGNGKEKSNSLKEYAKLFGLIFYMFLAVAFFAFIGYITLVEDVDIFGKNSANNSILGHALGWEDLEQPLYAEEYLDIDQDPGTNYWDSQTSVLAEKYSMEQRVSVDGVEGRVEYTVVKVRLDFLYEPCLNDFLDYGKNYTYYSVEPEIWGADAAYRLYRDDTALDVYLLCYDNMLVEFRAEYDLTEAQMQICGEKFLACED